MGNVGGFLVDFIGSFVCGFGLLVNDFGLDNIGLGVFVFDGNFLGMFRSWGF